MSSPSVIAFDLLESRDREALEEAIVTGMKGTGCQIVYFGRKKEDDKVGVLCTQWASAQAATAYSSSKLAVACLGVKETQRFELTSSGGQALTAPCTEVFTAYDARDGFADNLARFVEKVGADPPKGYYGFAVAKGLDGKTFRLLLGWESVDAHVEAKGLAGGVIQANIHELREKRGAVDLFHVEFKEQ